MKIVEAKCLDCGAKYEILENFPKELLICPGCDGKNIELKKTDKEFRGCGGGCSSCSSCE
ncbi:MAG: zinc ribbon domain-containing protein [Patescibacteria group bacterium]|nr:zinc ribbon domain-containing protein [Patescibacteria group bacterium]